MSESKLDLPTLRVSDVVHVYPTSASSPIWFHDAVTERLTNIYSVAEYEVGVIQDRRANTGGEWYRVTLTKGGRVLYVDWLARWWVRLPSEPSPHRQEKVR